MNHISCKSARAFRGYKKIKNKKQSIAEGFRFERVRYRNPIRNPISRFLYFFDMMSNPENV